MFSKKKRMFAALLAGSMLVLSSAPADGLFAKKGVQVAKVTGVTAKRTSETKAKVKFAKIKKAKGYQVVYATNKSFSKGKKTVSTNKNVVTLKGLKSENVYYVKIRGFKAQQNKKVYGAYSKVVKIDSWIKDKVESTPVAEITKAPENTPLAEATKVPESTPVAEATKVPESTPEVVATEVPMATKLPQVTAKPEAQTPIKDLKTSQERFKEGVNRFSYNVFEQVGTNENAFISPFSLSVCLSMVANGANDEARAELEEALGITDLNEWNEMIKKYVSYENSQNTKLDIANSIWHLPGMMNSSFAKDTYIPNMTNYYGADVFERVLFADETKEEINAWADKRTNGMIPKFLKENLSTDTMVYFMNAVYFESRWQNEFLEMNTGKKIFYGKNKQSEVDMMYQGDSHFSYIEEKGLRGIELPYEDDMVMDVFITEDEDKNVGDVFSGLSSKEKTDLLENLGKAETTRIKRLRFPKFQLEYKVDNLAEIMQNMGVHGIYKQGGLSGISEELVAGGITQKTKIEVDEYGTKAAAVTGMQAVGALPPNGNEVIFDVDRPFVYVIRDTNTGVILFMGIMQDME